MSWWSKESGNSWSKPPEQWSNVVRRLHGQVRFENGLSNREIDRTEDRYGFRFPPDLRAFLQTAMPKGPQFPNWRSGNEAQLREWLDMPRDGVLFDIEQNSFWLPEWGPKPAAIKDALSIASGLIQAAPKLIPIFMHRMMPDEPHLPGNPVFSVHQTDIIVYGLDLQVYLHAEFHLLPMARTHDRAMRSIRFWDVDRFQEVRWQAPAADE